MKTLANIYIWFGGTFQTIAISYEILQGHNIPLLYGLTMIFLNLTGAAYGSYRAKDNRYVFFCLLVAFLYIINLIV